MLYLIKWDVDPTGPTLMSASSVDDLIYQLDEVGDPGEASFRPFRGPIAIGFRISTEEDDVTYQVVSPELWSGDTASNMGEYILKLLKSPKGWTRIGDTPVQQWPMYRAAET